MTTTARDLLNPDNAAGAKGGGKPFWSLDFENERECLDWLNAEIDFREEKALERLMNQRKNLAAFRGIDYRGDRKTRSENSDSNSPNRRNRGRNPRVLYNHMVDMVEQDVSRATKYRGAVFCKPASEDRADRINAKIGADLIEQYWEKSEFDHLTQKHVRRKKLFGDDFIGVFWNKNAGPYHLDWVQSIFDARGIKKDAKKISRGEIRQIFRTEVKEIPKVPLLDPDTGKQAQGPDGPVWIDRPMRRGEIQYRLISSWDMLLESKDSYEKVDEGTWSEWVPLDTVKAMHPAKAADIEADSQPMYDADSCDEESRGGMVRVRHTFHRSTDLLDQGRYIKWCRSAILRNGPNPYVGWDDRAILPWARTPDIDTPETQYGDSTVTHGRAPLTVYNNLISMDVRNHFQFSHPKWMAPRNSVKPENLTNDTTLLSFKGPVPPVLSQPAVFNQGAEATKVRAKEDMQQIMGVYGISRGEPPAGVTANVALTFLDEQEDDRANVGVAALTRTQRDVALQTLWLMADYYDDDEGRLEDLLGKTRADQIRDFKMSDLRNIGDLRLQNTTALPQQRSARTQFILDISKERPNAIPDDMFLDLLELGDVEKMRTVLTVALRKAEEENDAMMNGRDADAPEAQEYHLAHYRIHVREMNEPFYAKLEKGIKGKYVEHAKATEMFLVQICERNPQYLGVIMKEFPLFPLYYKGGDIPALLQQLSAADAAAQSGSDPSAGGPGPGQMMPPPGPPELPPMPDQPLPPGADVMAPPPQGMMPGAESISPSPTQGA